MAAPEGRAGAPVVLAEVALAQEKVAAALEQAKVAAKRARGLPAAAASRGAASSLRAAAAALAGSAMLLLLAKGRHGSASNAPDALRMAASAPSSRASRARMVPGGLDGAKDPIAARGPDAESARQNVLARASARAGHAAMPMTARRAVPAAMAHRHAATPAHIAGKVMIARIAGQGMTAGMTARSAGMAMRRAVLPGLSAGPSCHVVATLNGWPRPRRRVVSSASPR